MIFASTPTLVTYTSMLYTNAKRSQRKERFMIDGVKPLIMHHSRNLALLMELKSI